MVAAGFGLWGVGGGSAAAQRDGTVAEVRAAAASPSGTPTLTVVGFGAALRPTATQGNANTAYQISINFHVNRGTAGSALSALERDMAAARAKLADAASAVALPASAVRQSAPWLNFNNMSGEIYQANASLTVTTGSVTQTVRFLDQLKDTVFSGQQSMFVNQVPENGTPAPSSSVLAAAYAQALAQARETAQLLAQADGLVLGPQLHVAEGAPAQAQCGAMAACGVGVGPGIIQPAVGPGEMLVAVTVTYATSAPLPSASSGAA